MSSGGIVNFHRVVDVFEDKSDSWCSEHQSGQTLASYLPVLGSASNPFHCYVRRGDGEVIVDPESYTPEPGDSVFLREIPRDPSTWALIVISVILAAGSYLANRLMMPTVPKNDFGDTGGPVQVFGGIQTIATGGVPLPIVYGEVRTGGNIVDSFESPKNDSDFLDETKEIPIDIFGPDFVLKIPVKNRLARSVSVLNTRIILCAGPIEDITQIEIDERPVAEFPGLVVSKRAGTQNQPSITDFNKVVTTRTLVTAVDNGSPITVTTQDEVDQIEIVLRFLTGIYRIDDDGFRFNRKVEILVEHRLDTATSWITTGQFVVDDFAVNTMEYRIRIAPLDRAIYEIRVTRVTADETGTKNFSAFQIHFINEIQFQERTHPGVAQMAFSQLPGDDVSPIHPTNYTAVVKGFNEIRIYTSKTEFTTGWTDNPAWCCGHFLTSKNHGMGTVFTWDDIDIPSFLLWAEHADELVEDGRGNGEKRSTFNRIYDQRTTAFEIIQDFATGSGVSIVFKGAKFRVVIDKASLRTHIFSEANVLKGQIRRAYFPKSELPTRITVQFRNLENNWEIDSVMEEDPDAALGLFQQSKTFRMLHITRPGQAARESMRIVRANTLITQGVEITSGLQAASVTIGNRIGVSSLGVGIGLGSGQITHVAADNKTMHLDDEITFLAGKTYAISVQHVNDGVIDTVNIVHQGAGVTTNIVEAIDEPWRRTLQAGDTYAVGEALTHVKDYRVDSVEFADVGNKNFKVKIQAGLYDEDAFDLTPVSNPSISANELPNRDSIPGRVLNLKVIYSRAEAASRVGRRAQRTLEIDWDPPFSFSIDHYEILFREASGNTNAAWQIAGTTRGRRFEISQNIAPDNRYQVAVLAVSPGGLRIGIDAAQIVHVGTF